MTYTAQDEARDLRVMLHDALAEIERLRRLAYPPTVAEVGGVGIEVDHIPDAGKKGDKE